jgi:hypothetical protein
MSITLENELLIRLSKVTLSDDDIRAFKDAFDLIDWERLITTGLNHGTYLLLAHNLRKLVTVDFAQSNQWISKLLSKCAHVETKNLYLTEELLSLVSMLREEGIESVPYKGPVLAQQAYGDVKLRPFVDLDLIVEREKFSSVVSVLQKNGYAATEHRQGDLTAAFLSSKIYRRLAYETEFCRKPKSPTRPVTQVDVHWEVAPPHTLTVDFAELLQCSRKTNVFGTNLQFLEPEMLLLIICAHANKHRWSQLKWAIDVAELLRQNREFNWNEAYKIARRHGISRKIDLALLIAQKHLHLKVPQEISDRISRERALVIEAEKVKQDWFSTDEVKFNLRAYWRIELLTTDNMAGRARFMRGELFEPTVPTYFACPLPDSLFSFYRIIHPTRMIYQFIASKVIPL